MADERTTSADEHGPMCPPEEAPEAPATASEAPALPAAAVEAPSEGARGGIPGAEGGGLTYGPDGSARPTVWRTAPTTSLFAVDVGTVEGAKDAVRTLARRIAGVENSAATVPACAGVAFQSASPYGAQWVMNCDLTPGTLYLVTYDALQPSYTVDAYSPVGGMCVPEEQCHG